MVSASKTMILALAAVAMLMGQVHSQAVAVSMASGSSTSFSDGTDVSALTSGFTNAAAYNDIDGLSATASAKSSNEASAENDLGFAGSFTGVRNDAIESPEDSQTEVLSMLTTEAQSIGAGNSEALAVAEGTASAFDEPFGDDPVSFSRFLGSSRSNSGPSTGGVEAVTSMETQADTFSTLRESFATAFGDLGALACYGDDCPRFGGRRVFY